MTRVAVQDRHASNWDSALARLLCEPCTCASLDSSSYWLRSTMVATDAPLSRHVQLVAESCRHVTSLWCRMISPFDRAEETRR